MKKGFTLIELLSVIIVLAIIALMTTVVILGVVEKARKEAFKGSTYGLVSAGTIYYANVFLEGGGLSETKTFEISGGKWITESLPLTGSLPVSGVIKIDVEGNVALAVSNGKWCAVKSFTDSSIRLEDIEACDEIPEPEKVIYTESILNGADPVISTGMVPVVISEDGVVTVADIYSEWYKYEDKKNWANAVLVDSVTRNDLFDDNGLRESKAGEVIDEVNILAFFVWIPRYEYNGLTSSTSHSITSLTSKAETINITFQGVSTTTDDTHPAFDFGGISLPGFWIGKFETSKATSGNEGVKDATQVRILPHQITWRNINVYNIFYTAREMATTGSVLFGLDKNNSDSHMMKNIEWGAVAYLSHSIYGKNGELNINNCSQYMTGIGGNNGYEASTDNCSTASLRVNSGWTSTNGTGASTTGNVSGIYDMSGGSIEYVAGYNKTNSTDSNYSGFGVGQATTSAVELLPIRYFDSYNNTSGSATVYTEGKRGDATIEMGPFGQSNYIDKSGTTIDSSTTNRSSWYGDGAIFVQSAYPWFMRSGYHNSAKPTTAGLFNFSRSEGGENGSRSFRIAIAPVKQA